MKVVVYWQNSDEESMARKVVGILRQRIIGVINSGVKSFHVTVTARPLMHGFDPESESYVETLERTVFGIAAKPKPEEPKKYWCKNCSAYHAPVGTMQGVPVVSCNSVVP